MLSLHPCPGCAVLHQIFPEQLKASKYVTTDPEEADYFFADGEGAQRASGWVQTTWGGVYC